MTALVRRVDRVEDGVSAVARSTGTAIGVDTIRTRTHPRGHSNAAMDVWGPR
jgi:hypothetical protein